MLIRILGSGTGGSPGSRRWRAANLVDTGEHLVVVDCGVGCHYRLSDRGLLTEVDYVFLIATWTTSWGCRRPSSRRI